MRIKREFFNRNAGIVARELLGKKLFRIGVDYAKEWKDKPLRFILEA